MALPKKERIKRKVLAVPVSVKLDETGVPEGFTWRDQLWPEEKEFIVLGISSGNDLTNQNIDTETMMRLLSAKQYILSDGAANMYEAYIEVTKTKAGFVGMMRGIKSIPSE